MKISYSWLKEFIDIEKTPAEVSSILTDIGLEVEHVEKKQAVPGNLEGVIVGRVLTCVPHPNADRLRVTTVDIGTDKPLQIVCGAPNVAVGQKVMVATVGTILYPIDGESFKIKRSKIRGEASEGMLCAEDEMGIGRSHEGILLLESDAKIGQPAADYLDIQEDDIFEIGLTPNRSDAASHLGVARDVAAYLRNSYHLPAVWEADTALPASQIDVSVKNHALCPRYTSLIIADVEVKESPDWLKERLTNIGLRPRNNVVDITNYVLHELGQPLHAFDAAKIQGHKIEVKSNVEGAFVTLDGVEHVLHPDDLMICDAGKPLCIAGVMGGLESGVTSSTQRVFLESAYFNAVSVRKTAKRHGLKTDSSFRFERGTDPNMTAFAIKRAAYLILELAGGRIESAVSDDYPSIIQPWVVAVDYRNVQKVIGKNIPQTEIKEILSALHIRITSESDAVWLVEVPPYRVDVTREIDVIEEILRIYGYNRIEFNHQIRSSIQTTSKPDREVIQNTVADLLINNGFYEILNNSLSKLEFADDPSRAVEILNPLSSDLAIMRQSLLFSGLQSIAYNQKRKMTDLALFEFGKTYFKSADRYQENARLSILIAGSVSSAHWFGPIKAASFFDVKGIVHTLLQRLNITAYEVVETDNVRFDYGLSYTKGSAVLVSFGSVSKTALLQADVEGEVFYADIDWDLLLKSVRKHKIVYEEVPKYPAVRRDLALLVDEQVTFETLRITAIKTDGKLLKGVSIFDVYKGDKLPSGKKSYALSFVFQDEEKTLTDKQIDVVVQKLIANFEKEAGAEVR